MKCFVYMDLVFGTGLDVFDLRRKTKREGGSEGGSESSEERRGGKEC